MNNRHHIPMRLAVAEFRSMCRCLNECRFKDSVIHANRLKGWGLPQHPQLGKSKVARSSAAEEQAVKP